MRRKAPSPSSPKIAEMVLPARASISASMSRKGRPSRAATARPTLLLPVPIKPVRMTFREGSGMAFMEDSWERRELGNWGIGDSKRP